MCPCHIPSHAWIARSSLSNPQRNSEQWMLDIHATEEQREAQKVKQLRYTANQERRLIFELRSAWLSNQCYELVSGL